MHDSFHVGAELDDKRVHIYWYLYEPFIYIVIYSNFVKNNVKIFDVKGPDLAQGVLFSSLLCILKYYHIILNNIIIENLILCIMRLFGFNSECTSCNRVF